MTTKTASILIRTEPEIKEAADQLFNRLGSSTSSAINIFLRKAIEIGGFPFEVALSTPNIPNLDTMSKEEIEKILDESYDDSLKNGGYELEETLERLDKKYGF